MILRILQISTYSPCLFRETYAGPVKVSQHVVGVLTQFYMYSIPEKTFCGFHDLVDLDHQQFIKSVHCSCITLRLLIHQGRIRSFELSGSDWQTLSQK